MGSREWIDEAVLGTFLCKRCGEEGVLVASLFKAGSNIHIDFYIEHKNGELHFAGRKVLKSVGTRRRN